MAAPAKGSTVETVLELLPVLGFPGLDWQAVLLLDLIPVPLWNEVEAAGGNDAEIGRQIVDVAALEALLALAILLLKPKVTLAL